jgi:hypothetical protein
MSGNIDYSRFLRLTTQHGVTPLVYRSLKSACWDKVPAMVQTALQEYTRANTGRCLFLTAELIRLLRLFDDAGIPAVPIKGPAIASAVYGSICLREFTDLDLLVRLEDLEHVQRLLKTQRYTERETVTGCQRGFIRNECEQGFWGPENASLVEIHWRLAQRYFDFPLDLESRWGSLVETDLEGYKILAFPPEDQLLLLCVHGARHLWSSLKWICDVAEFVRAFPALDWQQVLHDASQVGDVRTILLGLALAQQLLDAELPAPLLARIQSCRAFRPVTDQVISRLDTMTEPSILQIAQFHIARKTTPYQKLRQCVLLVACPSAGDWASRPARLPLLVYRPFRLLLKYRPKPWRLLSVLGYRH